MFDEILTATEVARTLRIPLSTTYELIRRGELRSFRAGRHLRVRSIWLQQYIDRLAQNAAAPKEPPATARTARRTAAAKAS